MSLSSMNPINVLDTTAIPVLPVSSVGPPMHSPDRKVKHLKKIIKRRIIRDKNGNQVGETVEESYIPINSPSQIANENTDFVPASSNATRRVRATAEHLDSPTNLPLGKQKQNSCIIPPSSVEPPKVADKIISIDLTGDTSDDDDRDTRPIFLVPSTSEIKFEQDCLDLVLSPGTNLPLSPSTLSPSSNPNTVEDQSWNAHPNMQNFHGTHVKDASTASTKHKIPLNMSRGLCTRDINRPSLTIGTISSPSSSSSLSTPTHNHAPTSVFSINPPVPISPETIISLRHSRPNEHDGEELLEQRILPESPPSTTHASIRKPSTVSSRTLISSSTPQSSFITPAVFTTQTLSTNVSGKGLGPKLNPTLSSPKPSMQLSPSRVRSGYHVPSFTTTTLPSSLLASTLATHPSPEPPFPPFSPVFTPLTASISQNTGEKKTMKQPELHFPTSKRSLSLHQRRFTGSLRAQSELQSSQEKQQQQQHQEQKHQLEQQRERLEREYAERGRKEKKELEMILAQEREEMKKEQEKRDREKELELRAKPRNITTLTDAFLASPTPPLFTQTISSLPLRSNSPTESSLPLSLISSFTPKTLSFLSSPSFESQSDISNTSSHALFNPDLELGFEAESLLSPLDIFLRAVFIGDAKTVARILDQSTEKAENDPDKNKSSFLHILPENQYQALFHASTKLERKLPIASLALERGADINAHEKTSLSTSLALAVQFGPPRTWQLLIEKGADLHCGSLSFNCVQHAILQRNISFLHDCVSHGVNIDISQVRIQLTPENVEVGKKKRKEREPEREKRKNTIGTGVMKDMGYGSPLQFAAMMGQFLIIPDLLRIMTKDNKCAFDVNPAPVQYQWSLLHQLVASSSFTLQEEIITRLVELGADLEAVDENGQTPFLSALQFNNTQAALVLLECGANPTAVDARGQNAFHVILNSTVTLGLESVVRKICKVIAEEQATPVAAKTALTEFLLAKSEVLQMRTVDWIQIMHRDASLSLESTSLADPIRKDFNTELEKWTEMKRIIAGTLKHYKIAVSPQNSRK